MRRLAASTFLVVSDRLRSFVVLALLSLLLVLWGSFLATFPVYLVEHNDVPSWVRVTVVAFWLLIFIALLINYLARPTNRTKTLKYLMRDGDYGWLSPLLYAVAIFLSTTVVFSAATRVLWEWRMVNISDPTCKAPCVIRSEDFFNFYTWHFLDSIPLLKVNETLHWKEPLVYRGAAAGWLIVALKVAIILPLIQSIRIYWKIRSDQPGLRIDAWPRVVHEDEKVTIKWSPSEPPEGYVFDVYIREPTDVEPNSNKRKLIDTQELIEILRDTSLSSEQRTTISVTRERGWKVLVEGTTTTSAQYTCPRAGAYRFQAHWRKATEHRGEASKTLRNVKVIAKPKHTNDERVGPRQ